jgi:hypothetical protein
MLREKAVQLEKCSLGRGKGRAFVEVWGTEESSALGGRKVSWVIT